MTSGLSPQEPLLSPLTYNLSSVQHIDVCISQYDELKQHAVQPGDNPFPEEATFIRASGGCYARRVGVGDGDGELCEYTEYMRSMRGQRDRQVVQGQQDQ